MPWLSLRFPLGDTSPLTRFATGLDAALQRYLGSTEMRLPDAGEAPILDPWGEDLFHLPQPIRPPIRDRGPNDPANGGGPRTLLPGPSVDPRREERVLDAFWGRCADDPDLLPALAVTRSSAGLRALAPFLAGMVLPALRPDSADRRRDDRTDTPFRGFSR
jgi:hypothetical protein